MRHRILATAVAAALLVPAVLATAAPAGAATFDVTVGADDGSEGTLRWAVGQAAASPGEDVVVVDPSVGAITLDACGGPAALEVVPSGRLTIEGNGATVTQTCADRLVVGDGDLVLRDLTLTGGTVFERGGGIRFEGPLQLDGVAVRGNSALGGGGGIAASELVMVDSSVSENVGGGVLVLGGGAVAITRSAIVDNRGSGVSTHGPVTVLDSEVSRNTGGGDGGGISVQDAGRVRVERSRIEGNVASGDGGGIYAEVEVELVDTDVIGNHAGEGGGIWSWAAVRATDSRVDGNVADGAGGGIIASIWEFEPIELVATSVSGNRAGDLFAGVYGPAAITLTGSAVQDNVSGTSYAGVNGARVMMTRSVVSGNRAADEAAGVVGDEVVVDTSTVSGNVATRRGGISAPDVTLAHATVVENGPVNVEVDDRLDAFGSVVAGAGTFDCHLRIDAAVVSQGRNFSGDTTCGFDTEDDTDGGGDPQLSPLARHDGPTANHVPESGSPLLDAIPAADARCTGTDQRGVARPANGGCDIGAVEVRPVTATATSVTTPFETPVATDLRPLVTDPDGVLSSYRVSPPAHGAVDPAEGGVVTYRPDAGFAGADSYTYVVCSAGDVVCTSTEAVSITVLADPSAPSAAAPVAVAPTFAG